MTVGGRGKYPTQSIEVIPFPIGLDDILQKPDGQIEGVWPPIQLTYLTAYLRDLGVGTIVIEEHYIDRDYIQDHALLYSRSLRWYPNYCQRLHFFAETFDRAKWDELVRDANTEGTSVAETFLQTRYLGFMVARPLPGSPVGRTVLVTVGETSPSGLKRAFPTLREYRVHLAGLELKVRGLAFQQQDQGVSACATAALWSTLHGTAPKEGLQVLTPAEITEAASRYALVEGRSLPSEGLAIQQICEATRANGLSPLVVRGTDIASDRGHIAAYIGSGFPVVLCLRNLKEKTGHAICALGMKLGPVPPRSNPDLHYVDTAQALTAVFAHDDRLGPYASAGLFPYTASGVVRTGINIEVDRTGAVADLSLLEAIVVPVPGKLRLTAGRLRGLGHWFAEVIGRALRQDTGDVTLTCRYVRGVDYQHGMYGEGLSDAGMAALNQELVLSRYVGLVELDTPDGRLLDVLVDTTETRANPAVRACVRRGRLSAAHEKTVESISRVVAAKWIS